MNPLWAKAAPWLIGLALVLSLLGMTHLYMAERDAYTKLKAEYEQAGKDGKEREDKLRDDHKNNLIELEKAHGKARLVTADTAVANYKLRHPDTGASGLCRPSPSQTLGNGTQQELIPVDGATLQECAKDSGKVAWFQDYCLRNNCPVED